MSGSEVLTPSSTLSKGSAKLPLDLWWIISQASCSAGDVFRLSRVNKDIWWLLLYQRSSIDAEFQICGWPQRPSTLDTAIRNGYSLMAIEVILRAYSSVAPCLIEGPLSGTFWEPPLHLAAKMNRFDVVDLLLKFGCPINIRWLGQWEDCYSLAHENCKSDIFNCPNALSIARQEKNADMARFLLERGIEDRMRGEFY
ncbi:hypothetical protein F5X99DRAFT_390698 [Biscogniauxia marginata]|nr:hypothetical protein F5X99DRAFT_390698 [Biscogniauxia marginata]